MFVFFHLNYFRVNSNHLNQLINHSQSVNLQIKKDRPSIFKIKKMVSIVKLNKSFIFTHKNFKL